MFNLENTSSGKLSHTTKQRYVHEKKRERWVELEFKYDYHFETTREIN